MQKRKRLQDEYQFPGFRPKAIVKGKFSDRGSKVVRLERRQKKRYADVVDLFIGVFTTTKKGIFEIYLVAEREFIWKWKFGEFCAERAEK